MAKLSEGSGSVTLADYNEFTVNLSYNEWTLYPSELLSALRRTFVKYSRISV